MKLKIIELEETVSILQLRRDLMTPIQNHTESYVYFLPMRQVLFPLLIYPITETLYEGYGTKFNI